MDNKTWILVADASQAKIYSAYKANLFDGDSKKLTLVNDFQHPESRKSDQELVTDKQGKFGAGTFVEQTDPKRHEEDIFAAELAKALDRARLEGHYKNFICIAPPTFMGMLNKHLSNDLKKMTYVTIEKDYTRLTEVELIKHLQTYL